MQLFNTSSTSLKAVWGPVPDCCRYGIILGYRLFLKNKTGEVAGNETVAGGQYEFEFSSLLKGYPYNFSILAFTSKGDGNLSQEVVAMTEEEGKATQELTMHKLKLKKSNVIIKGIFHIFCTNLPIRKQQLHPNCIGAFHFYLKINALILRFLSNSIAVTLNLIYLWLAFNIRQVAGVNIGEIENCPSVNGKSQIEVDNFSK